MAKRVPSRRCHMLDEEQTKDAMKVLKRYCATKYRNSVIRSQGDLDNIMTPRTPTGPHRMSTYSFGRLPTFDRDSTILSVCPGFDDYRRELTLDFREHDGESKSGQSRETLSEYVWRQGKSVFFYLGHKHVLFLLFLVAFVLFGGFLFMLIEQPVHEELKKLQAKRDMIRIKKFSESILEQLLDDTCIKKTNDTDVLISAEQTAITCIEEMTEQLKQYEQHTAEDKVNMNDWEWTYANSVFYTVTLIATIGYGNITCKSLLGKILTISYGVIGIPLMLTTMNIVGKSLLRVLLDFWLSLKSKTKSWFRRSQKESKSTIDLMQHMNLTKNEDDEEEEDEDIFQTFPIWLYVLIAVFFIMCCSATFSYLEGWDFFTSVYFTVISFTTVGFGDVVPSNLGNALILLFFYFPGFCMGSLFIAIIQMLMENHYMLALQLIDQQQEVMDQNHDIVIDRHDKTPDVIEHDAHLENYGNVQWRTEDHSRESSPYPSNIKRKSSVMISHSGIEVSINTPPVLNALLNGVMQARRSSALTRSESILSRNFPRGSMLFPHSPSSCDMFPGSNRHSRNFFSPTCDLISQKATTPLGTSTGVVLPVINEYGDEDNFHVRMKHVPEPSVAERSASESMELNRKNDQLIEEDEIGLQSSEVRFTKNIHKKIKDTNDSEVFKPHFKESEPKQTDL